MKVNNDTNNGIKDTGYGKILITAILTALLTSISQYFLQNRKMSDEHLYWQKRYEIENLQKLNSQKIQLIDDINRELLQLEVKAKQIKIEFAASRYFTDKEDAKELSNMVVQYHKDLYLFSAKVQTANIFFGQDVDRLFPALDNALALNYQNNLLRPQTDSILPEFELDFETIDTLEKIRLALIRVMLTEISDSYKPIN